MGSSLRTLHTLLTLLAGSLGALTACSSKDLPPPPGSSTSDDTSAASDSTDSDPGTDEETGGDSVTETDTRDETGDSETDTSGETGDTVVQLCETGDSALQFDGPCPTNLLLISIDTVARDRVGRYAGDAEVTDFLDGLLSEGVALEQLRACSNWTAPGMSCIMTGRSNIDQGVIFNSGDLEIVGLPDEVETLAEQLAGAGYQTTLLGWQPIFRSETLNLTQGYKTIDIGAERDAEDITKAAVAAASAYVGGDPWFLHLHYFDPHDPYEPPGDYTGPAAAISDEWESYTNPLTLEGGWSGWHEDDRALYLSLVEALYDGELRFLDDQLEALFEGLTDAGALTDTLVVLVSDHGEQFMQHGSMAHDQDLYMEETLALGGFWAEGLRPGTVTTPTTHTDLLPTLLNALQLPAAERTTGAVIGDSDPERPVFAMALDGEAPSQSVESGTSRLLYHWPSGEVELYALDTDPGELTDRADVDPDEVLRLWTLLEPEVEALEPLVNSLPTDPGL